EEISIVLCFHPEAILTFRAKERQVKLRCRRAGSQGADLQARLIGGQRGERGDILQGEQDLEERAVAQTAFRLQRIHQVFKGKILVSICLQADLALPPQQRTEGGGVREIG